MEDSNCSDECRYECAFWAIIDRTWSDLRQASLEGYADEWSEQ